MQQGFGSSKVFTGFSGGGCIRSIINKALNLMDIYQTVDSPPKLTIKLAPPKGKFMHPNGHSYTKLNQVCQLPLAN